MITPNCDGKPGKSSTMQLNSLDESRHTSALLKSLQSEKKELTSDFTTKLSTRAKLAQLLLLNSNRVYGILK
jgi:hypothetical protein